MQLGTITPDQIRSTADKHVCGFFSVTDVNGDKTHVQIGAKKDLDNKIDETIKSISSLPDQIFKITFRKSMTGKNPAVYSYYLSKNPNAQPSLRESPQTIINTPFEPARSMSEALKDATALAETKAENRRLQDEIDRLKLQVIQQEQDLSEEEEQEELKEGGSLNQITGFAKDVLPQFLPMVDKYFELAEKKIALQAMALNRAPSMSRQRRAQQHPFRPFWSPEDTEKTQQYFDFLEKLPDNAFYKELEDLQNNAPGLYMVVIKEFNINENGNEENTAQ